VKNMTVLQITAIKVCKPGTL